VKNIKYKHSNKVTSGLIEQVGWSEPTHGWHS